VNWTWNSSSRFSRRFSGRAWAFNPPGVGCRIAGTPSRPVLFPGLAFCQFEVKYDDMICTRRWSVGGVSALLLLLGACAQRPLALKKGRPIQGVLAPGGDAAYTASASAGAYVCILVDQGQEDLVVDVIAPDNTRLLSVDAFAACNNTAGTKLDASAKMKEEVRLAMAGRASRPHRVRATIGEIRVNGQLHATDGSYSLTCNFGSTNTPPTRRCVDRRKVPRTTRYAASWTTTSIATCPGMFANKAIRPPRGAALIRYDPWEAFHALQGKYRTAETLWGQFIELVRRCRQDALDRYTPSARGGRL
jgi:hypothetical protein